MREQDQFEFLNQDPIDTEEIERGRQMLNEMLARIEKAGVRDGSVVIGTNIPANMAIGIEPGAMYIVQYNLGKTFRGSRVTLKRLDRSTKDIEWLFAVFYSYITDKHLVASQLDV